MIVYGESQKALGRNPGGFFAPEEGDWMMTQTEKSKYENTEVLRQILNELRGKKFRLDCGHHVTLGHFLGNDITIINGKKHRIICSQCSY